MNYKNTNNTRNNLLGNYDIRNFFCFPVLKGFFIVLVKSFITCRQYFGKLINLSEFVAQQQFRKTKYSCKVYSRRRSIEDSGTRLRQMIGR